MATQKKVVLAKQNALEAFNNLSDDLVGVMCQKFYLRVVVLGFGTATMATSRVSGVAPLSVPGCLHQTQRWCQSAHRTPSWGRSGMRLGR